MEKGSTPARYGGGWQLLLLTQPQAVSPSGRKIPLSPRAAALLAHLALVGPTRRSTVAMLLWPDAEGPSARNNLRQLLHRLRRSVPVVRGREVLSLDETASVDLRRFRELVLQGCGPEALAEFSLPEEIPGADELGWGAFHLSLQTEYARLRRAALAAAAARADRLAFEGDLQGAISLATAVADAEPASEAGWRRLILLHRQNGDRAAALEAYRRCRRSLRAMLDVEPSLELQALAEVEPEAGHTYVLRVSTGATWGASLLDLATGRRQCFPDPASLVDFLTRPRTSRSEPRLPGTRPDGPPQEP